MRILFLSLVIMATPSLLANREKININKDWNFILQDVDKLSDSQLNPADENILQRTINVPHDWTIEGEYDKDNPSGRWCGYLPAGIAWYRKELEIPSKWQGKHVRLEFDGVFRNSTVWVDGVKLGYRPYGWISFSYDISDLIKGKNKILIAVRVDNELQPAARWYTGSGIYGHTWVTVADKVHVDQWGTYVRAKIEGQDAEVSIDTSIRNQNDNSQNINLKTQILDANEKVVDEIESTLTVPANGAGTESQKIKVKQPQLWSPEDPNLYKVISLVEIDGKIVDRYETPLGFRTIRWDKETGFWLNGENIKLRGVCNHWGNGPLGAAVPDKILRKRLQILKDMGCNSIRTAHYPRTPIFYEMCDEMGILVMDEIFDGWKQKALNDYGAHHFNEWWERDLTDWILRDRNHPCIFVWSIGNETRNDIAPEMVSKCHELDPTRLVTSGSSNQRDMDIWGENGHSELMTFFDKRPDFGKPFISTEAPHTWQVRGYYRTQSWYRDGLRKKPQIIPNLTPTEIFHYEWTDLSKIQGRKQVLNSSYDNATVRVSARRFEEMTQTMPRLSGQYRWTGFDYLGEANLAHGSWPFKAFMGGVIDLINIKKDLYYFYQSRWTKQPMVHLLPHWTHPTMELGTKIPVWVYSNCDEVELFLNGKSLGKDQPGDKANEMQCDWLVGWEQGTIKAIGYKNGEPVAEMSFSTAQAPSQLKMSTDTDNLKADETDIAAVTIELQDTQGNMYPYGENRIFFHLDGPAILKAVGNGDPVDHDRHQLVDNRRAFMGLAKAYINSTDQSGDILLLAGAILGERRQVTSNKVSIDVEQISLRGEPTIKKYKIYYTIDGSQPNQKSTEYSEPFEVELGTDINAVVMADGKVLLKMNERFAEDVGMSWNNTEEQSRKELKNIGFQAEDAKLSGGSSLNDYGDNFYGSGYVDFHGQEGSIQWFQENDGSAGQVKLTFRYAGEDSGNGGRPMKITVNGKVIKENLLFKNTGDWHDDWGTITVNAMIEKGANHITLSTTGKSGMNVDALIIE